MERVVVDPSVLVSAVIQSTGNPAAIWRAAVDRRIELVVCPHLLAELIEVLARPKFRRYVTVEEAEMFVAEVARYSRPLPNPTETRRVSRDANDDYLVELAKTAAARALVSGDRDLTDMTDTGIVILTPKQAVEQLL